MTEMTQPLVTAPNETISVAAQPVSDTHAVTFSEVVYAHFNWWHHREGARRNATRRASVRRRARSRSRSDTASSSTRIGARMWRAPSR